MIHHGTIRKYTAALLDFFNNIEVQYSDSNSNVISKNVPLVFSSKEKATMLEQHVSDQLIQGNYNVLPRGSLSLVTMAKAEQRVQNKNLKINKRQGDTTFDYMYNSVPYEFTFQLDYMCRGMNEATQIIEQLAPKFNPTVNIDIWDASNLDEPTRVPVRLLDIGLEMDEYEEFSSNIVIVSMGISIMGNLYPPIKTVEKIKNFKMYFNDMNDEYLASKSILGWDVDGDGMLTNGDAIHVESSLDNPPVIISIVPDETITLGANGISMIYEDNDNKFSELTFGWNILSGDAAIEPANEYAILTINSGTSVEVEATITDKFGNYASLSKTFTL